MYTAILPIAAGWLTFRVVAREMRIQRLQNDPRAVVARRRPAL
jgi:hypothetical protein